MTADTAYVLSGPLHLDNHGNPGTFGVTNRSNDAVGIAVQGVTATGSVGAVLDTAGASWGIDLDDVASIDITAATYPVTILLLYTPLDLDLEAAPTVDPTAPPVYITGAGMARVGGTNSQTGPAPSAANVGASVLGYRIAKAGDPLTWAMVPAAALGTLGEAMIVLAEYPAVAGHTPARIDGAGAIVVEPSTAGHATAAVPAVDTTGAALDLIGYYDDPDYHATIPAGYTEDVYFPRPGAARISAALASKAGAGAGGSFGGAGSETQWKVVRASFSGVTRPAVQTATGFSAPGASIVFATFAAPPTRGNLIVAWYCYGQGVGEAVAALDLLAP